MLDWKTTIQSEFLHAGIIFLAVTLKLKVLEVKIECLIGPLFYVREKMPCYYEYELGKA